MKIFNSSLSARFFCARGSAVAIGNFDGLHLGHRHIISTLVTLGKKQKIKSIVFTLEPHPVTVLAPQAAPSLINTLPQKKELLAQTKIDAAIFEPFTHAFSKMAAEDFFHRILIGRLNAKMIIVGYDFTFGSKRSGNVELLEKLCAEAGVILLIAKPFMKGDTLVSSTIVRKLLGAGDVKRAADLLNRPYFMDGKVIHGDKRGSKLGFPTLNIEPTNALMPALGVYATRVQIGGRSYKSVTNVGTRPTFHKIAMAIETHVFDFHQSVYGKSVRLSFIKRLRDEEKFDSLDELVKQIKKDIAKAKAVLNK